MYCEDFLLQCSSSIPTFVTCVWGLGFEDPEVRFFVAGFMRPSDVRHMTAPGHTGKNQNATFRSVVLKKCAQCTVKTFCCSVHPAFRDLSPAFGFEGLGLKVWGLGCRVEGLGCGVRVEGQVLWFRV